MQLGDRITRIPPRPNQGRSSLDALRGGGVGAGPSGGGVGPLDPYEGTWEVLTTDEEGKPFLDRHDVWGWVPTAGARPADNLKGFNFVPQQQQQGEQ